MENEFDNTCKFFLPAKQVLIVSTGLYAYNLKILCT
jgi:hypothetical protein